MGDQQCPLCFGPLEVREVTPCVICGGSSESVIQFDPSSRFTTYRLPDDQLLVLCRHCELEEFMVPNGWGYRLIPDQKLPVNALRRGGDIEAPHLERDKFCDDCHLRLTFAKVVSNAGADKPCQQ